MAETRSALDIGPKILVAKYQRTLTHPAELAYRSNFWLMALRSFQWKTGWSIFQIPHWLSEEALHREGLHYPSGDYSYEVATRTGDTIPVFFVRDNGLIEGENMAESIAHFDATLEEYLQASVKSGLLTSDHTLHAIITKDVRFAMATKQAGQPLCWHNTDSNELPVLVDAASPGSYDLWNQLVAKMNTIDDKARLDELRPAKAATSDAKPPAARDKLDG